MLKRTCPNNHVYDASIYGDCCPLCPNVAAASPVQGSNPTIPVDPAQNSASAHTRIASPQALGVEAPMSQPFGGGNRVAPQQYGETRVSPNAARSGIIPGGHQAAPQQQPQPATGSKTVIRRNPSIAGGIKPSAGRKLVGFLVTYNRDPMGKAYNIYEGRNYIGRDASCDICIPDDNQMSGRHMSILYRNVDNKFKFRDEQSSNGTFINKELLDDGNLENYDIIRTGNTLFVFVAIPQIG